MPAPRIDPAALALVLADLAGVPAPLAEAAAVIRDAIGAGRVTVWLASRPERPVASAGRGRGEPPAPTARQVSAGRTPVTSAVVQELITGGEVIGWLVIEGKRRRLGTRAEPGKAAQLLAPLALLEETRARLHGEVAETTRRLEQQQRFISMIVDSLPLGLYVVDRDYKVRLWNRGREQGLQGVGREDVLGRSIFDVLHRQPAEQLRRELDDVFATGQLATFEAESSAFGEPRSYRLSKIPMRFEGDGVTHVIAVGEDITDWKRAQMRTVRAEKLAAVGQLAAGVMHEVNNPLATIGACAETITHALEDGASPDTATLRELMGIIHHEVHRCRRLVDDLLGFSRQSPAERVPLDIELVLDETLSLLGHHSRFKRARVRRETSAAPLASVLASREQLMQVFMSLLLNAMEASGAGSEIVVRTRAGTDRQVVVEIVDQGEGIPPGSLSRIFDPFFTTKSAGQGTGLGLAISYGIVTDHGGRIEVDSTVGKGSTFSVILNGTEER